MSISNPVVGFLRERTRNAKRNLGLGLGARIPKILGELRLKHRQVPDEKKACEHIVKALKAHESTIGRVTPQYGIEKGFKVDISIGDDHGYAIEVKLLRCLKTPAQRRQLYGQLRDYRSHYDCRLMVIIVGDEKEEFEEGVDELYERAEEQNVDFYYLRTYSK